MAGGDWKVVCVCGDVNLLEPLVLSFFCKQCGELWVKKEITEEMSVAGKRRVTFHRVPRIGEIGVDKKKNE